MSDPTSEAAPATRRRKAKLTALWRALRFLLPYRRIIIISMVCAVFVGMTATVGLSTLLPALQVLLRGDTVQAWVDRQIVQQRLGVNLVDDLSELRLARVATGAAQAAGLSPGAEIVSVRPVDGPEPPPPPGDGRAHVHAMLALIADADATALLATVQGRPIRLDLPEVSWSMRQLRGIGYAVTPHPVGAIATLLGFVIALSLLANTVRFFQEHLSDRASIYAVNDIRRRTYDHTLHIPLPYFLRHGTSEVTSRLVSDAAVLQDGLRILLGQTIQQPIVAFFAFLLAMWISWELTLLIVLFAPIMMVVLRKFGKKLRRANRAAMERSASMLGQIESSLNGIRVVKGANAERFERRRYRSIMTLLMGEQVRMSRYDSLTTPVMEFIALAMAGGVLIFASYLVLVAHTLDPARFLLVMACLVTIGESLRKIGKLNNVLQRCNAAATRLFEVLDLPSERPRTLTALGDQRGRQMLIRVEREVRFDHVSFSYPGAAAPAVSDVDLVVPSGASVAVVGRNGSGKTTLLAMLPRLFDPTSGRITIDGVDNRDIALRALRRAISVVTQDSVIFPGTVAENIAYGLPNTPLAQIETAARQAFAHDFIVARPGGYDAPLDGLGSQLSGGQKQRLCIARAILRNAPMLILDEATSQVDAESEHLIQQAIQSLLKQRTTFVIAHRLSTILSADFIAVMEQGRIVGLGTHEQLQRTCDVYQQLYERQFMSPAG